jgi:1-acyl-sn-glycerol-3-phosphate acyltransferase
MHHSLFRYFFLIISRFLLYLCGWSPLSNDQKIILNPSDNYRRILIFSHSSYWDFFILTLYLLAYPSTLAHVYTLIKPGPFRYFSFLLTSLNGIPATPLEQKGGGAVNRITNYLQPLRRFNLLISPKGTIQNAPWKQGYYHIAQSTYADFIVAGLDYCDKQVYLSPTIPRDLSKPDIDYKLQQHLSQIVPLHPSSEESDTITIRPHIEANRSVVNWYWFIINLILIFCLIKLLFILL